MAGSSNLTEHPLIRRLVANEWWLRRGKTPSKPGVALRFMYPTGNAFVPYEEYTAFLEAYAEYIMVNEHPCVSVVEAHGPRFKLFIDVDMKLPDPMAILEETALERLLRCIYGAVAAATKDASAEMIVCTAEPYQLDNDGLWKAGLHLHWPGILVDTQGATALCRDHCVPACQAEFPGLTDWVAVFDESVFGDKKGLRLIASTKGKPGSKGTTYMPAYSMAGTVLQKVERPFSKLYWWLQKTSIHIEPQGNEGPAEYSVNSGGGQVIALQEHQELLEAVRRCITHEEYQQVRFTSLRIFKTQQTLRPRRGRGNKEPPATLPVISIGLDSKRCPNLLGRTHHTSNHVYLVVNAGGLFLKCYNRDPSTRDRRFGPCEHLNFCVGQHDWAGTLKALMLAAGEKV